MRPADTSPIHAALADPYAGPSPRWSWFQFDLPDGASEVSVRLEPGTPLSGYFSGEVGWWLWLEHPLTKATLSLQFGQALPPAHPAPLPLPLRMDKEREIITLQPMNRFYVGTRWADQSTNSIWLDEVIPDYLRQEFDELRRGRAAFNEPMLIAGQSYTRGLGTHANSSITYGLSGGQFDFFAAEIGHQGTYDQLCGGVLTFQVWVDDQLAFDSGPVTRDVPAQPVLLNIRGANTLELRTLDGGDGSYCDLANWANARLFRQRLELQLAVEKHTAIPAGERGCIPLDFYSTVDLTNVSLKLLFPLGTISNPTLTLLPGVGSVSNLLVTTSNAAFVVTGHIAPSPLGQTHWATLCFDVDAGQPSRFLPLRIVDVVGMVTDGTSVTNAMSQTGKVAIVADAPLLESLISTNGQPLLYLYGQANRPCLLESTATFGKQAPWTTNWQGVLTNSVQEFRPEIPASQTTFFRARSP